ncbi:hypothetical protein FNAPI_11538 [Fusarium napiforme]|uniref:Uncharacterized protein n=1 Tax=Fusarium napiforme TaxID=42672 RepID=A0A8H5ILZ1_9HYPO|nr:hypothetical protein FNAPI_11538 [Fusarium napiforme]
MSTLHKLPVFVPARLHLRRSHAACNHGVAQIGTTANRDKQDSKAVSLFFQSNPHSGQPSLSFIALNLTLQAMNSQAPNGMQHPLLKTWFRSSSAAPNATMLSTEKSYGPATRKTSSRLDCVGLDLMSEEVEISKVKPPRRRDLEPHADDNLTGYLSKMSIPPCFRAICRREKLNLSEGISAIGIGRSPFSDSPDSLRHLIPHAHPSKNQLSNLLVQVLSAPPTLMSSTLQTTALTFTSTMYDNRVIDTVFKSGGGSALLKTLAS